MRNRHFIGRGRPGARQVAPTDSRAPMLRLLQDGTCEVPGMIVVSYEQQWRTLNKAVRMGFLDREQRLTEKGREFLAANG